VLATDLTVEVRDVSLVRVGQIATKVLDLRATLVKDAPGEWVLRLPVEHPMVPFLRAPGAGIIVTHVTAGPRFSGPVRTPTIQANTDDPRGTVTFTGVTDDVILWNRLAYPTPITADVAAQNVAYDVRTGQAETVMHAYVAANIGTTAPAARKVTAFTQATDLARGGSVTKSARWDVLGILLTEIGAVAGLGFRVVQVGAALQFQVTGNSDKSPSVRLDLLNGTLASTKTDATGATLTRAIVAGQGEGALRKFVERTSATAIAAEVAAGPWGRIETFLDQRNTNDDTELAQAGDKAIAEHAAATSVVAVPSDDQTMRWPQDWDQGDTVGVVVEGQETKATVSSVTILVNREGARVGAAIGPVQAYDPLAGVSADLDATTERVSSLERNSEVDTRKGRLVGEIIFWGGLPAAAPSGWLPCDGALVSRTTYAALFAVLGTVNGAGDGSLTFALPDMRNRVPMGASATYARGAVGGEAAHVLTAAEGPVHNHTQDAHNHGQNPHQHLTGISTSVAMAAPAGSASAVVSFAQNLSLTAATTAVNIATTATNQAAGGGAAHNNLQPYGAQTYLIRT